MSTRLLSSKARYPGLGFASLLRPARLLFPEHCAICRRVDTRLCERCAELLAPASSPDAGDVVALDATVALFAYSGAGRTAIARLKYDNHRDAMPTWAHLLADAIDASAPDPVGIVTWVPTSRRHRRDRGYDQAELLARAVGRELGVRAMATVERNSEVSQRGRTRSERSDTSFRPSSAALGRLPGRCVAVVDDVRTTGASLNAVAEALRSAGARRVIGATIAATPAPGLTQPTTAP